MELPIYPVHFVSQPVRLEESWNQGSWQNRPYLKIDHFRPESSSHRPLTCLKLLYNENGIFGLFMVKDRYVICRHTRFQEPVYKDSCVEFFFQPESTKGYFNFEFNCGGTLLSSYITDPTRIPEGFKKFVYLSEEECRQIKINTSLSAAIKIEITRPITWQLAFFIPFKLLKNYVGNFNITPGTTFRANFFKCADECSHPHWASWSPLDQLNFHLPHCFGRLKLIKDRFKKDG